MNKFLVISLLYGLLSVQTAAAKQYQKVDHCDYDEDTLVETCYGQNGNLLQGWAVEGEQPRSAAAQRREMRRNAKKGKWTIDLGKGEMYAAGGQPYTLSKYRKGKKNGLSKDIDYRGFGVKRVQYKNGIKDGPYEEYFMDTHKRKVRATYKDGLLDGKAFFYNYRGQQIGKAKYLKGKLISGYCKSSKREKEVYDAAYIKSFPNNELITCRYSEE